MISIRYPTVVQYSTQNVTQAEFRLVKELYKQDRKVTAINFIRRQYNLGLKEAKDVCDKIGEMPEYSDQLYAA